MSNSRQFGHDLWERGLTLCCSAVFYIEDENADIGETAMIFEGME